MINVNIRDDDVYDSDGLIKLLDLRPSTLETARDTGAIQYGKRSRRCFYLGKDVKAWLFSANGTNGDEDE